MPLLESSEMQNAVVVVVVVLLLLLLLSLEMCEFPQC